MVEFVAEFVVDVVVESVVGFGLTLWVKGLETLPRKFGILQRDLSTRIAQSDAGPPAPRIRACTQIIPHASDTTWP